MLVVLLELTIKQIPSAKYPGRNKEFFFDAISEYEVISSPFNQTDTAEFTIPKDIYARDSNNKLYSLVDTNKPLNGSASVAPLFLKGDEITFNRGYLYQEKRGAEYVDVIRMTGRNGLPDLFTGYISEVSSDKPFVLKCEDAMWKLKQIPVKKNTWKGYSVQKIFTEILKGTEFTVSKKSDITIDYDMGHFETGDETAAQVLARVRKDLKFCAYFRGKELRIGYPIYYEDEARTLDFGFQENIISSDLVYARKDDVILSAVVTTKEPKVATKQSKDGGDKTRIEDKEILVYTNKDGVFEYTAKKPFAENVQGERRTLTYTNVTEKEMFKLAVADLQKYHYTGFSGDFTTFALPHVKPGDNARITSPVLPDQNGTYKVKQVRYYGSESAGARQEITVDYKLNI